MIFFPFFCCHCFNLGLCCFFFFPESLQHFSTAFLLYTVVLCKTPLILHYLITFSCFSVFLLKFKLFNCVQNFPGSAPPATMPPRSPFPLLPLPSTLSSLVKLLGTLPVLGSGFIQWPCPCYSLPHATARLVQILRVPTAFSSVGGRGAFSALSPGLTQTTA